MLKTDHGGATDGWANHGGTNHGWMDLGQTDHRWTRVIKDPFE